MIWTISPYWKALLGMSCSSSECPCSLKSSQLQSSILSLSWSWMSEPGRGSQSFQIFWNFFSILLSSFSFRLSLLFFDLEDFSPPALLRNSLMKSSSKCLSSNISLMILNLFLFLCFPLPIPFFLLLLYRFCFGKLFVWVLNLRNQPRLQLCLVRAQFKIRLHVKMFIQKLKLK